MIKLKSEAEIAGIRKSCQLLAKIMQQLKKLVVVGTTTYQLNKAAEDMLQKAGVQPAFSKFGGFPTALCTSVNDVVIHGLPNKQPLVAGDLVGLDLGLVLNGYFSDMAITMAVGPISEKSAKLLKDTEISLHKGIEAISIDGRLKDIGRAVSGYLKPLGYGIVDQYCGHGVGLAVHEEPSVVNSYPHNGPNPRFQNGMVLAIEPMVTMGSGAVYVDKSDNWSVHCKEHSLTAHFEHTIAIFNNKVHILTLTEEEND
jgi:methionyl aminopeptidase